MYILYEYQLETLKRHLGPTAYSQVEAIVRNNRLLANIALTENHAHRAVAHAFVTKGIAIDSESDMFQETLDSLMDSELPELEKIIEDRLADTALVILEDLEE
jgi:hypothetical protein